MKQTPFFRTLAVLFSLVLTLQNWAVCQIRRIPLPQSQVSYSSCYVSDDKSVFLPVGGGIYLPQDSIWFLPPSERYYFTSVAPVLTDTAFFAIGNTASTSELIYVRSSSQKLPIQLQIQSLDKGFYHLIYRNNLCCIWGFSGGHSKIGVLAEKQVKWVFTLKGIITQVQLNDAGEIFFAAGNSIYQLTTGKRLLTYEGKIFGFDFNSKQQIVLSCEQGVGYIDEANKLNILARQIFGTVTARNNTTFVLPPTGRFMYRID
jgi:hypothetical protein